MSVKRVQEFLLRPESKHKQKTNGHINGYQNTDNNKPSTQNSIELSHRINEHDEKSLRLTDATAMWVYSDTVQQNGIFDMNLEIKRGLCAIVGPVGCGKSTLFNVILGELELDRGSIAVNGLVSYASQEPWVFRGSVRQNIVFIEEFDEQRYNKVVEVCALERDFELLEQGDATIVGEKGSSLSGGQRARVNLARAIYKRSDIYLLDDPLSAVDTDVGKHIFEKCIKEFLADKICVLITHQLQYLINEQNVVVIDDGKIEEQGPFQTLEKFKKGIPMVEEGQGDEKKKKSVKKRVTAVTSGGKGKGDGNTPKEKQLTGSITFSTYAKFFRAAQSTFLVVFCFVWFVIAQFAWNGADYFISVW